MKRFEKVDHIYTTNCEFKTFNKETFVEICFRNDGVEIKYCDNVNPSYGGKFIQRYFYPIKEIKEIKYFDKPYLS